MYINVGWLDHLSKGLCRLFRDGFKAYCKASHKLLPVPTSMQTFKSLAMRCSGLSSCNQQLVAYAKLWAQNNLCFGCQQNLPSHVLEPLFSAACSTLPITLKKGSTLKPPSCSQACLLAAVLQLR